jgi:protein pelota
MRVIHQDFKKGELKVKVENLNDLWYLSQIILPGDLVKGKTERKINLGGKDQKAKIKKVIAHLTIEVEKLEFHKYSDILRISGKIKEGPEDIAHNSYHTINVEINTEIMIKKEKWMQFQINYVKEAKVKAPEFLAVVMDRTEATIAMITSQGFNILLDYKGDVEKKAFKENKGSKFYQEIISKIDEYDKRYNPKSIIIASPAFFKEDLFKLVNQNWKKKVILGTCSNTGANGISEILKRDELKKALTDARTSKEELLVDKLMQEIKKDGSFSYGIKETESAIAAIKTLLLTDTYLKKAREEGNYESLNNLMKTVDNNQGHIEILDGGNPAGKKLDGLGGIGAILRYKV